MAIFNPDWDLAIVILYNRDNLDFTAPRFADRVAENIFELMAGKPSIPLDFVSVQEHRKLAPPAFTTGSIQGSYRCALTAFPLPASIKKPFEPAATGEIHVIADGKGAYSEGTWTHRIETPNLNLICKLKLAASNYSVAANGSGTEVNSWELIADESARGCLRFFPPLQGPVITDSKLFMTDATGSVFYTTSINPFAVLNSVCQRAAAR